MNKVITKVTGRVAIRAAVIIGETPAPAWQFVHFRDTFGNITEREVITSQAVARSTRYKWGISDAQEGQ